jgi:hypothetical protein
MKEISHIISTFFSTTEMISPIQIGALSAHSYTYREYFRPDSNDVIPVVESRARMLRVLLWFLVKQTLTDIVSNQSYVQFFQFFQN